MVFHLVCSRGWRGPQRGKIVKPKLILGAFLWPFNRRRSLLNLIVTEGTSTAASISIQLTSVPQPIWPVCPPVARHIQNGLHEVILPLPNHRRDWCVLTDPRLQQYRIKIQLRDHTAVSPPPAASRQWQPSGRECCVLHLLTFLLVSNPVVKSSL